MYIHNFFSVLDDPLYVLNTLLNLINIYEIKTERKCTARLAIKHNKWTVQTSELIGTPVGMQILLFYTLESLQLGFLGIIPIVDFMLIESKVDNWFFCFLSS